MNRSLLLSGLFLLGCWLIAAADSPDGPESKATEPEELPERAVFEVDYRFTMGLGEGAQWKVFAHKVHNGRYGKRVVRSLEGGAPSFVFYDAKGQEVARQEVRGMLQEDIDAMLLKYGFFPGDTREPAAESVTPPSLAKPASGGSCGARQRAKKEAAAAAAAAAQTEGQHTATQLAEAAAAAATAAAKAATAAAAAAEAAVAALAAVQEGSCTA